jgi:hypothetical protein
MKTNKKTTNRRRKKPAKKEGWLSNIISKVKNGNVMKKAKSLLSSVKSWLDSVIDWVDYNEWKIHSVLILGFGLLLICPIIEPWKLVGILAILLGVMRLLMRR